MSTSRSFVLAMKPGEVVRLPVPRRKMHLVAGERSVAAVPPMLEVWVLARDTARDTVTVRVVHRWFQVPIGSSPLVTDAAIWRGDESDFDVAYGLLHR